MEISGKYASHPGWLSKQGCGTAQTGQGNGKKTKSIETFKPVARKRKNSSKIQNSTSAVGFAPLGPAVLEIVGKHNLSKAFGHGAGFTVGLFFLDLIFNLVLGFGSSQYIGNPTIKANSVR